MARKTKRAPKILGPIIVMGIITLILMLLSFILSLVGFESEEAVINASNLEMSLITVNNIFSVEGIKYLLSSGVTNFRLIEPLALIIISLITTSIAERSGLIKHLVEPLKKLATPVIIFFTLVLCIIFTFFGDYSFVILLPLIGVVYKYLGRNPMLGIMTTFIGITCSYGTGIIYNYNTYLLGTVTELSATIEVDPTFSYDVLSCMYIMIVSTFVVAFLGTAIINKYLAPKFRRIQTEEDEIVISNKALWFTNLAILLILISIVIMILPGGILLDNSKTTYVAKLMSETSPFKDAFIIIMLASTMICSAIYGFVSGNIKHRLDYNIGLYKSFENCGYVFVLMFFASIMFGVLEWTNIGNVIAAILINAVSSLEFSGSLLIIVFFIFTILISILIPNTYTKWNMSAPLVVPLFMRANITPEFTQFIFSIADGIGKSISPFFIYFIIMLGFLQKYNDGDKKEITIFGTIKLILPTVLLLALVWLVLIVSWNIIGIPLGINTYATM
ncbi:MAG: AbgT family transporter [Bacilli bacterium]|nr:AbgT family transporter [Bacilli bacterium]